jgi:hypothetical protein
MGRRRTLNLNFGDSSEQAGIELVSEQSGSQEGKKRWYSLDGCKLSGRPTAPGLYIYGNKKVFVR